MTLDYVIARYHLTNQKRSIVSATRLIINKLDREMTKGDGITPTSYDPFLTWLREVIRQIKNLIPLFPQIL